MRPECISSSIKGAIILNVGLSRKLSIEFEFNLEGKANKAKIAGNWKFIRKFIFSLHFIEINFLRKFLENMAEFGLHCE